MVGENVCMKCKWLHTSGDLVLIAKLGTNQYIYFGKICLKAIIISWRNNFGVKSYIINKQFDITKMDNFM